MNCIRECVVFFLSGPELEPQTEILNKDVIKIIFKELSPKKLAQICLVSKQFNQIISDENLWNAFDLEEYFPGVFLEKSWEKYLNFQVGKIKIDKRLIFKTLYSPCPFSNKKIYETHSLILIPKGMSLNKLLANQVFKKYENYEIVIERILQKFGEREVADNGLKLITKTILEETRGKLGDERCLDTIEKHKYEVPDLLPVIACNLMRSLSPHEESKKLYKVDLGNIEKEKYSLFIKIMNIFKNLPLSGFLGSTADFHINFLDEVFTLCKEEFRVGGTSPQDFYLFYFQKFELNDRKIGISPMKNIDLNQEIEIKIE